MNIPDEIKQLGREINQVGGSLFVVGGAVRDFHMGIEPKDFDLLVVGLNQDVVLSILDNPQQVIGNAPVFMWEGHEIALARTEISVGESKHDFTFVAGSDISLIEDLARRDFTFNAMGVDVFTGQVHDPFGGWFDLQAGIIRPINEHFMESPERVLRGAGFASRFDFIMSDVFIDFAKQMSWHAIPPEQVWRHFVKAMMGIKPSNWILVLQQTGWIEMFPELEALDGLPQDSKWHPEGDALTHTKLVLDNSEGVVGRLAAICHDLGKATTTVFEDDGTITSRGHSHETEIVESFLDRIGCFEIKLRDIVIKLVQEHMFRVDRTAKHGAITRLSKRLFPATIDQLTDLMLADANGRGLDGFIIPETVQIIQEIAEDLNVSETQFVGMIKGRHLIELGMKPGKHFGDIIRAAEQAEMDDEFNTIEDGIEWVRQFLIDNTKTETRAG